LQGQLLKICYIDESGDTGVVATNTSPVQPVFVVGGIVLDADLVKNVTADFLSIKRRFFPNLVVPGKPLDILMNVVKGADLRKMVRHGGRNKIRFALNFLGNVLDLFDTYGITIFSRVWVKGVNAPINSRSMYTFSIQSLCGSFQHLLSCTDSAGLVIADSRTKAQNSRVSYSIFTRKFKQSGDSYGRILEMPTFGHDENHVGLQLSDYVCSALVFPIAAYVYCSGFLSNMHVSPNFQCIKDAFGPRLKALQYRYCESGKWCGGVTVSDCLAQRSSSLIF
jgi:hypothetical protein